MAADLLIGIDIGTTSVKSVLFDGEGTILAEVAEEYPTVYPHPNWAQQDPEDRRRGLCATVPQLFAGNRWRPRDVSGVGVSCQTPSMIAVDFSGRPLYPALIWMDRRSEPQCAWLHRHVGQAAVTRINGGRIDPYYMVPKVRWFMENEPELYRQTVRFLQANGYVLHKLCGAMSMDSSQGPLTLCFDNQQGDWSEALVHRMQIDSSKLPPVVSCSEVIGTVGSCAAAECGLAPGTLLVAGMSDGTAASLEAGLVNVGDAVEMTGQSTVLLICSDRPYLSDELIPLGHAVPGRYLVVGAMVASGGALRWFRDHLGEAECLEAARRSIDPFDVLSEKAAASPPGANRLIFLPYMFGERSPIWDSDARGVFFGLSLATTKEDMVRAVMEGAAYGLRHNVEAAARAGFEVATLACVGGGARSAMWNQAKADILNRPVRLPRSAIGAPLGGAILAAVGVGLYDSITEAVGRMVVRGEIFHPRHELADRYEALYSVYLGLYPALKTSYKQLAQVPHA